jgi:hypothetical protein
VQGVSGFRSGLQRFSVYHSRFRPRVYLCAGSKFHKRFRVQDEAWVSRCRFLVTDLGSAVRATS